MEMHFRYQAPNKIAYGSSDLWSSDICKRDVDYSKGICPERRNLMKRDTSIIFNKGIH